MSTLEALKKVTSSLALHPATYALGIGVANGVLAEARSFPFTTRSAVITALVLAAGETAILAEVADRKHGLVEIGIYSLLGVLIGLYPFVSANGERSMVQQVTGRPALAFA